MFNFIRRGPPRFLAVSAILLTLLLCIYYVNYSNVPNNMGPGSLESLSDSKHEARVAPEDPGPEDNEILGRHAAEPKGRLPEHSSTHEPAGVVSSDTCAFTSMAEADVDTVEQFQKFNFQPSWMKSREYWDINFEDRYNARKSKWPKLPLKVILVPHSHNDPGWLKTYEGYYHFQTRNILNHMANKLTTLKNMTFIWSEISFLARWWDSAHPTKRQAVQKLLDEGRLEITTGGWVMTDEATSHVYAMVDQLIEGHQWVKNTLGVTPTSGWSIDPFGHGATVPYLLRASGFTGGAVIQRIHYAWKQWLAEKQMGDFLWRQNWDNDGHSDFLIHNQPFDIYSIKHSCGPHPQVCLNFDFRKISGEYTEFSLTSVPIDNENVKAKAELLLEQYGRTGSLFPHNVVLMPIGDDFRYDHDIEWDQQYRNYKRIIDYINQRKDTYNAEFGFGTPKDYFMAIKERMREFKVLRGDFFVYSDIFSEGRPAYWSGYFTTRPYWKILDRELEAHLRSAEILYTFALSYARKEGFNNTLKILERDYEKLTRARQNLALFQHHDAITGTSKAFVMHDYALKMFEGIQDSVFVQGYSAQVIMTVKENSAQSQVSPSARLLVSDTERESYEKLPRKVPLSIKKGEFRKVILFNSLAQYRQDIVKLHVFTPRVKVVDFEGNLIVYQINPIWNFTGKKIQKRDKDSLEEHMNLSKTQFELIFVADLPPLSIVTYVIEYSNEKNFDFRSVVYCQSCNKHTEFDVKPMQAGDIQLENQNLKLLLDGRSGLLKALTEKSSNHTTQASVVFSAYPSAQFHSGAYLFQPDPNLQETEKEILEEYEGQKIVITSGPVASELTVIYGNLLAHSVTIYHKPGPLSHGIYIENLLDFEAPPKNRETEMFMRIITDINNGDPPEFYSDLNGFQMQKRIKVERIGIEGNYFPLTSMAYIQDTKHRMSLLVNHAQGAASWQTGWLEVMLDRRTLYDDSRGMGEGVVDNKRTLSKFWLLLENIKDSNEYSKPSLLANYLSLGLMYPPNVFIFETQPNEDPSGGKQKLNVNSVVNLISKPLPCDVHMMNLRTLSDPSFNQFPSESALMLLHRQGYACNAATDIVIPKCGIQLSSSAFYPRTFLLGVKTKSVVQTSLTGLYKINSVKNFDNISVQPMDIVTLNVTFVH